MVGLFRGAYCTCLSLGRNDASSIQFFFDPMYGHYMFDDELIASIANDVESKPISYKKN
jgi:hypothetical protein